MRLPLQVGTTAFWSLARCAAILLPATTMFLVAVPIVGGAALIGAWEALKAGFGRTAGVILIVGGVILLVLLVFVISAVKHLVIALRERPSDVILDGDTISVVGGPRNRFRFPLATVRCTLDNVAKTRTRLIGANRKLTVATLKLDHVPVASAVRPVEKDSLAALVETIHTHQRRAKKEDADAPAPETKVQVLRCPSCDAAAVPADAAEVTCAYCSTKVPVPDDLRTRLRAQSSLAEHRPANERLLQRLLDQPGARTIGGVMIGLGVPILLVWPAASLLAFLQWKRGVLGVVNVGVLVGTAIVAIAALFFLMRATLVDRMALSLVSSRFGAVAPRKPGEPHLCRACLAPLPSPAGEARLLVHCAYCDTENILGLDLRSDAQREAKQHRSLDDELERRRRERRVWAVAAAVSLAVLVGDRWLVAYAFHPHTEYARCRTGDAAACLRVGEARVKKEQYREAVDAYALACKHGDKQGCLTAAKLAYAPDRFAYADVAGVLTMGCDAGDGHACYAIGAAAKDPAQAIAPYTKGCDLHDADSCTDLGFAYSKGKGIADDKPRSLALYLEGCQLGSGLGCRDAAWVIEHGVPPDVTRAADLYEQGCAHDALQCSYTGDYWARLCKGDPDACEKALVAYGKKSGAADQDEVMFDEFACEKDPSLKLACWRAGSVYDSRKDFKKARAYWKKGCDEDEPGSCNDLGVKMGRGQGGGKDRDGAVELYDKACKLGSKLGCDNATNLRGK